MKKFLNLFFAAVLILVSAESLYAADLKVNGEYRVRGYSYSSVTGQDYGQGDSADYIDQRFLLTGTVTQGITSGIAELNLNNSNPWGDPSTGGSGGYGGNLKSTVHQAYLNVTFANANLMAGKRNILLGHGIILNNTADNLALRIPLQVLSIDVAYLKINEPDSISNTHATANDLDRNGYLLNLMAKPTDNMGASLFYITDIQKNGAATDNTTQNALGLTFDGSVGMLALNFEYDNISGNAGPGLSFKGQNVLLAAHANVGVAEVGIGYLRVTGADAGSTSDISSNSISGDFVAGHGILLNDQTRYGGGVDLNTRVVDANYTNGVPAPQTYGALNNNFHSLKLFAETMPTPEMNIGLEIFPIIALVDSAVFDTALTNAGAGAFAKGDTNVGQEVNVYGGYKLDKNLSVTAVIAYFNTGDVVKDLAQAYGGASADKKNVLKANAALTFTF